MKVYQDKENEYYSEKNRELGNCITVSNNNQLYYYEFEINNNQAIITSSDLTYINEAINKYREINPYVTIYRNKDNTYYKTFDEKFTFKLPIKILQPSKFFIDNDNLSIIEKYYDYDNFDTITIPVCIINDEYVILKGHTKIYHLFKNDIKMVNVYIHSYESFVNDFVYLAKENNIFTIKQLQVLSHEDYNKYWVSFCENYFLN